MESLADTKVIVFFLMLGFCVSFLMYSAGKTLLLKRIEFVAILLSALSFIPAISGARKVIQEGRLNAYDSVIRQNGVFLERSMTMYESRLCSEDSKERDVNQCSVMRNNRALVHDRVDNKQAVPLESLQLQLAPPSITTDLTSIVTWYNGTVEMKAPYTKQTQGVETAPSFEGTYSLFSILFGPVILATTIGMKLGQSAVDIGEESRRKKRSESHT
jgi:hypothetical protein